MCVLLNRYGKFKHKQTGFTFYVYNTHLDHKSEDAREKGLELIAGLVEEAGSYPVFITGDFNMHIDDERFKPITDQTDKYAESFSKFGIEGNTYHGFGSETSGRAIDFIFYTIDDFDLLETKVVDDMYLDRYYLSDHYPIYSKFKIIGKE